MHPTSSDSPSGAAANDPSVPRLWAIGGGKGGVGKSFISVNLAVAAAAAGYKVFLVDGDLGGANLDTLLGCRRPPRSIADFFARRAASLADLAVDSGFAGLSLIAGDAETLGVANPQYSQKMKLIRHLKRLPGTVVILDLGAGTNFNTLDLYLAADLGLAITTPEPTAVENCFAFIKAATLRDIERRSGVKQRGIRRGSLRGELRDTAARNVLARPTRLIVNRARPKDGRQVTNILHDMAGRFLGARVHLAGVVRDDPAAGASVRRMTPLVAMDPAGGASIDIKNLLQGLLRPTAARTSATAMGVNEELQVAGVTVHLQTEDLGPGQGAIRSQVFVDGGQVVFSRRTPYLDAFFTRLGASDPERVQYQHAAIKRALLSGRIPVHERRSA